MPLRNRSDFEQVLSSLQRLQREAEEEPHVPTYSYNHLHNTITLLLLCPMQPCYIGHTAPHTAFGCGEQVHDVGLPHYGDAKMQHSPMQCPSYTAPRVGNLCGLSRSRSA